MKAFAIGGLIACLASLPAWAECVEPPDPPHLPDGASASREDMLSAMKAFKTYDAAVKEFTECVHQNGSNPMRANRAVDKLSAAAEKFNLELHAFKVKNGG